MSGYRCEIELKKPLHTGHFETAAAYQHIDSGGQIDQVRETREQWLDFQFHYDLRRTIAGRRIYVETVLLSEDPDDPEIQVVSIHEA